jgi:hypothetical protein
MENRAAVFATQPQAVEVYQSGAWWPGELLGWRHGTDGSCQVWVRVVLDGREESAWTDLSSLRLPESHLAVGSQSAAPVPAAREVSVTRGAPARAGARDLPVTVSLPAVRDRSVAAGRVSGGTSRTGGRRRAPETGPLTAVPAFVAEPAPDVTAGSTRGRHRATAVPGRHRAADTGMLPVITAAPRRVSAAADLPVPRSAHAEESYAAPSQDHWSSAPDPEPELLTRPMRLGDLAPHARRPRLDGFLAGV